MLISPCGRVETDCLVRVLTTAGIEATAEVNVIDTIAAIALDLPGIPLSDTVAGLQEQAPGVPLLVITTDLDKQTVALARASGASALVTWQASSPALIGAVRRLLDGTATLPAATDAHEEIDPLLGLTARERDILGLLAEGQRNDEIAAELGISTHTVRTHVQHVLAELHVPHRQAAAALARRSTSVSRCAPAGEMAAATGVRRSR